MIGMSVKLEDFFPKVKTEVDKANFRSLGHAAASLRKAEVQSIETSDEPSEPGQPPHSRRGQLRRAIRFDVDRAKQEAVIGPRASIVGDAAAAHEFGEEFRGQDYPERPFAKPALEKSLGRLASNWAGSIGG